MTKAFVIADTHFGQRNIITFTDNEGNLTRPFATIEEHDEHLVKQWNSVVGERDRVYHLGDVVINRKALTILDRLNGKKVLIKGNHDIFNLKDYSKYFDDIRAYKVMPKHGIILSHIPIHPDCMARWKVNIHGHLHQNKIEYLDFKDQNDLLGDLKPNPRYRCISVEHLDDYTPMDLQLLINEYEDK